MIPLLAVWLLAAQAARANPQLDLCLPVAPKTCALTDKSSRADFLKCFETIDLHPEKPAEGLCAEELLHAKVHVACDETDIPGQCGKVKAGGNRVMSCLRAAHKKLSKPCSDALDRYDALTGAGKKTKRGRSAISAVRC
ncbi:MAG: hypothetical protein ACHQ51_12935 [Elusimicrobiota bacterium]